MSKKYWMILVLAVGSVFVYCPRSVATSLFEASSSADIQPLVRYYGSLRFEPCTLSARGAGHIQVLCAQLPVLENPSLPEGRRITLKIAWLERDNGSHPAPDPVFFIAGGPGQAATGVVAAMAPSLNEVRKKRDIFFVDQRGTGGSHPLACVDAQGRVLESEAENATIPVQYAAFAQRCAVSLQGRADPRYYTTTEAVTDLDMVRTALSVDKINLIGTSYGTRVVQQYARRYRAHTRTLTMDGVVPNELVIGGEFSTTFENAIALQDTQCRKNPSCSKRFPIDNRQQLRTLMKRLRQGSEVEYRDPGTGEMRRGRITADTVVSLAFGLSYVPELAALLPLILNEAASGHYTPLMSLFQLVKRDMDDQVNRALQWSVICAEDADRYVTTANVGGTLLGSKVAQMFFAPCKVWPTGIRPADFMMPFVSDLPTLLLSGERDPVTPPNYAEKLLKGLRYGRHIVAPGQGHGTIRLGCVSKLIGQFIDRADAASLDAGCVQHLGNVPVFTSFNGWEP
ncbi:alpha/beta hydrolase [Xylella taiwanensis]|uniref:Alpha/beta hydrolase n=1 Tax=Xylella taiwanensis TaxID=1444770 RepID=A0ABS8TST5_9GAMM|nr:alpha/beta hydrolase [Xylella taiwanensis]AXI83803.1 peptidase S33 [Xylella taiwanensis]MCD8456906.1 alpha/beta hydrolase [Xylella taiwanensis]MCD8459318.1 alpha/beta hydrolase [Xylella taiwanensis]MCD8461811.1 alpha/beta hydrolase [Xylella taiwanensis]MCD8462156.1 alpha/beta hydrolase [Xylella taiwanensis]